MTVMMNIIWRRGEIPSPLKLTNIKCLGKAGKTDYYSASSYRPISLTCIMCKLMEIIILERIVAYFERNRLIDTTQEDLRKTVDREIFAPSFFRDLLTKSTFALVLEFFSKNPKKY